MMTLNTIVAMTTFSTETMRISGVDFRIGFIEKMDQFPYAISITDVSYSDGITAGGIILSVEDISKCMSFYGEEFTRNFVSFILAHEIGHLVDFKHNPPIAAATIGGISVGIDREVVADTYAIINNAVSDKMYGNYISILFNDARNVEKNLCKNHRLLYRIAVAIDRRNMKKRFDRTIKTVREKKRLPPILIFDDIARKIIEGINLGLTV